MTSWPEELSPIFPKTTFVGPMGAKYVWRLLQNVCPGSSPKLARAPANELPGRTLRTMLCPRAPGDVEIPATRRCPGLRSAGLSEVGLRLGGGIASAMMWCGSNCGRMSDACHVPCFEETRVRVGRVWAIL
eukprot:gene19179-biopygen17478